MYVLNSNMNKTLEGALSHYSDAERTSIRQTLEFLAPYYGEHRLTVGQKVIDHAINVAVRLAKIQSDTESIIGACLFYLPTVHEKYREELIERYGLGITELVDGVSRMEKISLLSGKDASTDHQVESLRKMMLAMVADMRVVLIRLVQHTELLHYLAETNNAAARDDYARRALDIFAPLAGRLGMWPIKSELEQLGFRILQPETYANIVHLLHEHQSDRQAFIEEVIAKLAHDLSAAGIDAEISGRPKHVYSIYRKMARKEIDFEAIRDLRAIRVLVADIKDCYMVLGLVHALWTPIPKEFDDYIAKPKNNRYRSLHTAVIGPQQKVLEVQIRTWDMHNDSEFGIAAHWRYKDGTKRNEDYETKIAWLRQVLEWKEHIVDTTEVAPKYKTELFQDTVYVFTPQGKVIDLPRGSTPIDFAYRVHTDLGHRCRGAKVDGAIVPLTYKLEQGQRVEITAAKNGGPSRDWLNTTLEFIASPHARVKIRHWFNVLDNEESVARGRVIVERELRSNRNSGLNLIAIAHQFQFSKLEEFFTAVGRGEITARQLKEASNTDVEEVASETTLTRKALAGPALKGILIVGVDKLLTVPAKCCKPVPPDPIVGFVTRGRGVSIHRQSCHNVPRLPAERLIPADWGKGGDGVFSVDIFVEANDRQGLLKDITDVFSREKINVTAVNTVSRRDLATMFFTVEAKDIGQLHKVLDLIRDIGGVTNARRK